MARASFSSCSVLLIHQGGMDTDQLLPKVQRAPHQHRQAAEIRVGITFSPDGAGTGVALGCFSQLRQ